MPLDLLLALMGFAFVTSVTPGPNNLMLLASGANFGVRRTVPHMLGISLGHAFMVTLVGLGLMGLMEAVPGLQTVLKAVSLAYLIYLAWKIATAAPPPEAGAVARGRPLTFLQAAAFQWVNPKAWAMALSAVAAYAPDRSWGAVVAVAAVFSLVNLPSIFLWAGMGQVLRNFLSDPARLRAFNITMAVLLLASVVPVLLW